MNPGTSSCSLLFHLEPVQRPSRYVGDSGVLPPNPSYPHAIASCHASRPLLEAGAQAVLRCALTSSSSLFLRCQPVPSADPSRLVPADQREESQCSLVPQWPPCGVQHYPVIMYELHGGHYRRRDRQSQVSRSWHVARNWR